MPPATPSSTLPTVVPWTLHTASAVVAVETLVECIVVWRRDELTPGLRVLLILSLSLKWLFAWRVRHLSAGAALGLLLLEGTTIVTAFGAVDDRLAARLALGGTALAVIVLVASSLHAFPSAVLPPANPPRSR
jgi:hypothetical protein